MVSAGLKRLFDVVVGAVLLIVAVPLMLGLALWLAVDLRAWPLFSQLRTGRTGRPFRIVKLRTLPPGTPPYTPKDGIDAAALPPACTRLRRLHLDELPQLAMVVTGRLSLVGPRPEMPFLTAAMDPEFAAARTEVRPGCTGLWQISVDSGRSIAAAPEYDLWYLRHRTLRMDAWILWRTALLLTGAGRPIVLEDVPRWCTRSVRLWGRDRFEPEVALLDGAS